MKLRKLFTYENMGFALIILTFILGDIIPTSVELKWIIITLCFVWGINKRLKDIEERIKED